MVKFFRNNGRGRPSELGARRAFSMTGTDANPWSGPFNIDALHEQTAPWGPTLGVVAEGNR